MIVRLSEHECSDTAHLHIEAERSDERYFLEDIVEKYEVSALCRDSDGSQDLVYVQLPLEPRLEIRPKKQ